VNYRAFRDEFAVTLQITTAPLNLTLSDPIVTRIPAFFCANNEQIKVQVFRDTTLCRFLNICYSLAISIGVISDIIYQSTRRHNPEDFNLH
jgi:hypothetical protein